MPEIHIPPPPGYNFQTVLDSHGWRRLPPFAYDDATRSLWRTHRLSSGRVLRLHITEGVTVHTEADLDVLEQAELVSAVRRMLAMDVDLRPFYAAIRGDKRLAWVERGGYGRMLVRPTVWEDLVKTLFTTNVAWANTISMTTRLVDHYGSPAPDGTRTFPTPQQVVDVPADELTATIRAGYRVKSLLALAERVCSGDLDIEAWPSLDGDTVHRHIGSLHGFGAYATGAMLRLLGHHREIGIDSVVRGMFAAVHNSGEAAPDKVIEAFYAPYEEWAGLVAWMDVLGADN